jgi:hypothetical protein
VPLAQDTISLLIQVVIVLIVVGVALWLINRFIPMAGSIKSLLNLVVVVFVIVWLLKVFGLWGSITHLHVGS